MLRWDVGLRPNTEPRGISLRDGERQDMERGDWSLRWSEKNIMTSNKTLPLSDTCLLNTGGLNSCSINWTPLLTVLVNTLALFLLYRYYIIPVHLHTQLFSSPCSKHPEPNVIFLIFWAYSLFSVAGSQSFLSLLLFGNCVHTGCKTVYV